MKTGFLSEKLQFLSTTGGLISLNKVFTCSNVQQLNLNIGIIMRRFSNNFGNIHKKKFFYEKRNYVF